MKNLSIDVIKYLILLILSMKISICNIKGFVVIKFLNNKKFDKIPK